LSSNVPENQAQLQFFPELRSPNTSQVTIKWIPSFHYSASAYLQWHLANQDPSSLAIGIVDGSRYDAVKAQPNTTLVQHQYNYKGKVLTSTMRIVPLKTGCMQSRVRSI